MRRGLRPLSRHSTRIHASESTPVIRWLYHSALHYSAIHFLFAMELCRFEDGRWNGFYPCPFGYSVPINGRTLSMRKWTRYWVLASSQSLGRFAAEEI